MKNSRRLGPMDKSKNWKRNFEKSAQLSRIIKKTNHFIDDSTTWSNCDTTALHFDYLSADLNFSICHTLAIEKHARNVFLGRKHVRLIKKSSKFWSFSKLNSLIRRYIFWILWAAALQSPQPYFQPTNNHFVTIMIRDFKQIPLLVNRKLTHIQYFHDEINISCTERMEVV